MDTAIETKTDWQRCVNETNGCVEEAIRRYFDEFGVLPAEAPLSAVENIFKSIALDFAFGGAITQHMDSVRKLRYRQLMDNPGEE